MLDALTTQIATRLGADLTGLGACEAYPVRLQKVTLPAVLIDIEELEPADFGHIVGDYWVNYAAYCIYDPNAANAGVEVAMLAATVATRVSQETDFGETFVAKRADVLQIAPDMFAPELEGYLVWAVRFRIGVALGEAQWSRNPAAGVSVITVGMGDLDLVATDNQVGGANSPQASDDISLPLTPKG